MQRQEDSLLERLRNGERNAMKELYDTWSPVLFGIAMRYCGRRDEAEDMLQEALMKILNNIKEFRSAFPGSFEAWMKKITVNQCLTFLRKKTDFVTTTENIYDEKGTDYDEENNDGDFPDLSPEQVIRMIQQLPPGYRTVLNMYVFERMTHKEIATELKITENTSKSQLSKARNAMKKQLQQLMKVKETAR